MVCAKRTVLIFVVICVLFSDTTGKYLDEINEKEEFIIQNVDSWEDPDPCDSLQCFNEGYCEKGICICIDGYTGKNCEKLSKEKCIEELDICAETGGVCISTEDGGIECKCPKDKEFNEDEGCKDNFCNVVCGDNERVICGGDVTKKDKITCTCDEEGKAFDEENKECKDDKCFRECGIPFTERDADVQCVNGPFGNVKCQCKEPNESFDPEDKLCKTDYCKEKCGGETTKVKCDGNKFEESLECKCMVDYEDFNSTAKKCQTNYCKKVCGSDERIECNGDPYKTKKATDCGCDDENYVFKNKRCIEKCFDDEGCKHEGKCKGAEGSKLCECTKDVTEGDKCEVLVACVTGRYKNCKGDNGDCVFNKDKPEKAECMCPEGKKVHEASGYCVATCEEDKDCEGSNKKCTNDKFCVCKPGYEGEDCSIVTGCQNLEEKCKEIGTKCVFDENNPGKGKCECKDGYTYNRETNTCQDPYCYPYSPCKDGECKYNDSVGTGYCKCTGNKFYNYNTERCEDIPDKCLLRKTPCGENEVCQNGECRCRYKLREGEECERKFCILNPCFTGAKCNEEDGTCHCEEGKYYRDKKCQDAKCLKDFKKRCNCPLGTRRKEEDGDCVPVKEEDECYKDCGYGICIKKNNKETCKCFTAIADFFGGKCVLKKSLYCPGGNVQENLMKCKCEGLHTQADDGITCRLKTCDDEGVREDCAAKGGECEMRWKEGGFICKCPEGYEEGANGQCTDVCSIEKYIKSCADQGKFCYNSVSANNKGTCGCPPTLTGDKCSDKAENVYLIKNIFVLKKRYEIKSGINKVLLSADLMKSMEFTFNDAFFKSGYLYDYRIEGSTLKCSIWINFIRAPPKTELDKIKLVPKTVLKACEECEESAVLWPPNILLSERGLREVQYTKLEFCSKEVKNKLCGEGTICRGNKCTCDEGFKIIEYSIRNISDYQIQRCEDINECALGIDICSKNKNTICVNTFGSYKCVCKEGFKKKETPMDQETDKSDCFDMCTPSPCVKGNCLLTGKSFDCKCEPGYGGPFCNRLDDNYASSKKETVVVGSVLGVTLLALTVAFLVYIIRVKKRSHSGNYKPSSRENHREMTERRRM